MIVIGLVGGKGNGKSTSALYLQTMLPGAKRFTFAEPLKKACLVAYPALIQEQVYGTQAQKERVYPSGLSGRKCMEQLSDAFKDMHGPNVFAEHLVRRLTLEQPEIAVVEDVRCLAEGLALRTIPGAILMRVWPAPGVKTYMSAHSSETQWDKISVDVEIRPEQFGLDLLRSDLEAACVRLGLLSETRTWWGKLDASAGRAIQPVCVDCGGQGEDYRGATCRCAKIAV